MPEAKDTLKDVDPKIFEYVGRIAAQWSKLEYFVNDSIWALAETYAAYGQCMTSQIGDIGRRLDALIALMELRKFDEALIKKVRIFQQDSHGLAQSRNRVVHDPWMVRGKEHVRVQASAKGKPILAPVPVTLPELAETGLKLSNFFIRFVDLRREILDERSTLPPLTEEELSPIVIDDRIPKVSPAKRNQ